MHNPLLELDLVVKHQEMFKQKVLAVIDCLNLNQAVEILPGYGEGPALVLMQNDKRVAYLECFHGLHHNYRPEYANIIKEMLEDRHIPVILSKPLLP